jgi:acyl-CoA oxidase
MEWIMEEYGIYRNFWEISLYFRFDNVRIPSDNLLNRYSNITEAGKFETTISHPGTRFNTTIDALVGGRIAVAAMAISLTKLGLLIATRYAASRKQFGPPKKEEVSILDYLTHQRRLFVPMATVIGFQLGLNYAKERFVSRSNKDKRDVFLLASGFKAVCTWYKVNTLQVCRNFLGIF